MCKLIQLRTFGESDGSLVTFEPSFIDNFSIERLFYIFDVPDGQTRADHACMNAHILLIPVSGSVTVSLEEKGSIKEYVLNDRTKGLYCQPGTWLKVYNFCSDAVLMVLSDKAYSECDYINDYETYKLKVEK